MQVTMRIATQQDAATIGAIHAASWREGYRALVSEEVLQQHFTPARRAEVYGAHMADQAQNRTPLIRPDVFLVYDVDGVPAGMAMLNALRDVGATPGQGEISAFYFHPDHWGSGAAKRAMALTLTYMVGLGYRSVSLWVLRENARARRFYENCGLVCMDAEKDFDLFGTRQTVVLYRMGLAE